MKTKCVRLIGGRAGEKAASNYWGLSGAKIRQVDSVWNRAKVRVD